jgi:integrase
LLLDAANGTPYYLGVFTAVYTGLRRGEMLALRWCDVDLDLATLMLRQGIHPKIVSECLGHSGIAITIDTYSHVEPGLQEAAARQFEEGLQDVSVTHQHQGLVS